MGSVNFLKKVPFFKRKCLIFKWKHQKRIDILNTNIDAQRDIEIKCNGELIPFVKKFTLLGVILDEYLTFDLHTISMCSKVNWKIGILKKSSYLFDLKFRITLFKLFIMSKYDYCSTLFFYFSDETNHDRLEKNYCKSLKSYLNIKTNGMTLEEKHVKLKSFRLMPLRLRLFQNLVFFIFSLIKTNRCNNLLEAIYSFKKDRESRSAFNETFFNTNLYKYSFLSISIKLLNSFIYKHIQSTEETFRGAFEKAIFIFYVNSSKFWT